MVDKRSSLSDIVKQSQVNKKVISAAVVAKDANTAALISKLVMTNRSASYAGPKQLAEVSQSSLNKISGTIQSRTNDSEDMMLLFPEYELAAQILVTSIISPKDMMSTEIIYKFNNSKLPSNIIASIISIIKDELDSEYKLNHQLYNILRDVLFTKGSHVVAVLPESSLDELINGSVGISKESLSPVLLPGGEIKPLGLLGPATDDNRMFSMESLLLPGLSISTESIDPIVSGSDSTLSVTDNWEILKMPSVLDKASNNKIKDVIRSRRIKNNISTESIRSDVMKPSSTQYNAVRVVKNKEDAFRNSIGRPLMLTVPSEAVIPVIVPGNERKHVGYIFLVDMDGNFVSKNSSISHLNNMSSNLASPNGREMSSMMLDKARRNIVGDRGTDLNIANATAMYGELVEANLINRLRNGVYGKNVEVSNNAEIYQMMLARSLANQNTKMVFVPAEMVTYFANRYNSNGVGKSLLEDIRLINSFRAMSMFARLMGSLKNSIGVTEVKLKLDPRIPDPAKAIEKAIHEVLQSRQQNFPLGINSPPDLVNWVQSSGMEFSFSDHPGLPDMGFEFNQKQASNAKPDTDLDDELKKHSIMGLGLPPELVDNGFSSEFATVSTANNIMLAKRVLQIQEQFTPILTQHAKRIIDSDSVIHDALIAVVKENLEELKKYIPSEVALKYTPNPDSLCEFILEELLDELTLTLPNPTSTTLNNQMTEFDNWLAALDKAIDSWISADILNSEIAGDLSNNADAIKAIIRAHYIRQYLSTNNILTELNDLITVDTDGKPKIDIFEMNKTHIEAILRSSVSFINSMSDAKNAANKDLAQLTSGEAPADDTSADTDNADDDVGTPDGDADMSGDEPSDTSDEDGEDSAKEDPDAGIKDVVL